MVGQGFSEYHRPRQGPCYAICGIVPQLYVLDCGAGGIFNIENDPEEQINLNSSAPLLRRLPAKLEAELLTTYKQPAGPIDPAACVQASRNGGFIKPWLPPPDLDDSVPAEADETAPLASKSIV